MLIAHGKLHSKTEKIRFHDHRSVERFTFVLPQQLIVWCTLVHTKEDEKRVTKCPDELPRVPVILDTGCSIGVLANYWHLSNWFGIKNVRNIRSRKACSHVHGQPINFYSNISIWIHKTEASIASNAQRIRIDTGIGLGDLFEPKLSSSSQKKGLSWMRIFGKRTQGVPVEVSDVESFGRQNFLKISDIPHDVYPRLPLLGLTALVQSSWKLKVSGKNFEIED